MTGYMKRSRRIVAAGFLAWLMLISVPASAQTEEQDPPDQVDPPAEGEGEPLDDPTDPAPSGYTIAAHPSPTISLSGAAWRQPSVTRYAAPQRYASAERAAKVGWGGSARSVVLTSGKSYASTIAATSLAGAVNGPLLLTEPKYLTAATERAISRLDPKRVYVVGHLAGRVLKRVEGMGPSVKQVQGANRYTTAMKVAELAVRKGANHRTVLVVSGRKWRDSLGVGALAAGRMWPVLLAKRSGGRAGLAARVQELGAKRVFVAARRSTINQWVVEGLPKMRRLSGSSSLGAVAATARRGRALGLSGRPALVGGGGWADALTWGAMVGRRQDGVVFASSGPGLAGPALSYLQDVQPGSVALVAGDSGLAHAAECQLRSGRQRSWLCAEKTLKRQGYVVPRADGRADPSSVFAIFAFRKVAGMGATTYFGNPQFDKMLTNPRHAVRRKDLPSTHVEIDIGKQLVLLVKNGKVRNHIHTSTGKPSTPTVRGTFTVYEKRPYYQPHNRMYWSIFFYGGYAIHGYPEIPTYPASAGCARTYNGNQDFIYPRVFLGERVAVY